jgi:hypothetical protein
MAKTNLQTTATPGVYRRGKRYVYAYRVRGIQRWGTAETLDEARRRKRQAQTDADRGELENLSGVAFGAYARDWIGGYQGPHVERLPRVDPPALSARARDSRHPVLRRRGAAAAG